MEEIKTQEAEQTATEPTVTVTESGKFAQACADLAEAQGEFARPIKDAKANYGRYATLTGCLEAVTPALNKHGFFLFQPVEALGNGRLRITTSLLHKTGTKFNLCETVVEIDYSNRMNRNQAMGSAITYGKRYCLCSALGIAAIEDDDDGNASGSGSANENYASRGRPAPRVAPKSGMSDEEKAQFEAFKKAFAEASTKTSLNDAAQKVKDLPKSVRDALVPFYQQARTNIASAEAIAAKEAA